MGKVRTNVAFKGFSNNIDGLIYYNRFDKTCVRMYRKPANPSTPKQLAVRNALRSLIEAWKQLTGVVLESWRSHGKSRHLSGYFRFVEENAVKQRGGEPLNLCLEYGIEGIKSFTANPGTAAGSILCGYDAGERNDAPRVSFFAHRVVNGLAGGELKRFDGGPAAGPSFTLTGLEPGADYFVYAFLTDTAYAGATMVSASLSASCKAAV